MEVRYFNFPRNISFSGPPRDFRFLGSVYVLPRALKKLNRFLPEPQKTEPGLLQGHRHQFRVSSYWIENTLISVCNQKPDLWHEHADIKDVVFQCAGIVLAGINCFKVPLNCRKYKITTSDWSWNIYSLTLVFLPPVSDSVFSQEFCSIFRCYKSHKLATWFAVFWVWSAACDRQPWPPPVKHQPTQEAAVCSTHAADSSAT